MARRDALRLTLCAAAVAYAAKLSRAGPLLSSQSQPYVRDTIHASVGTIMSYRRMQSAIYFKLSVLRVVQVLVWQPAMGWLRSQHAHRS